MSRALVDTSVFVALESGRRIDVTSLPAHSTISVVTAAELRAGVIVAADPQVRARRLDTLGSARTLELIPIDAVVAEAWASLRSALRQARRSMQVNDAWIAATALAHDLVLITQDLGFAEVPGLEVALV